MGFFSRDKDDDGEQAQALARIEAGGIPPRAQERLRALGTDDSLFTSGLSVNEFALLSKLGHEPLAQVMGASVVRPGWQYLPALEPGEVVIGRSAYAPTSTGMALMNRMTEASPSQVRNYKWHAAVVCELEVLTDAWNMARRRALDRLAEEAQEVGADAVVGVHLRRGESTLAKNLIEFFAVGTAVKSERVEPGDAPVISNLSGQEFAALYTAGYWPVGLVVGTTVIYVMTGSNQKWVSGRFAPNGELTDYTQGVQHARKVALSHLNTEAVELGAASVVGLTIDVTREEHEHEGSWSRKQRDMIVTAHALGTAIVELERRDDERATNEPKLTLSLSEERR